MGIANDGLRFVLELASLAALGYWGFTVSDGAVRWILGLGAPVLFAVLWGMFMSPKASHRLEDPVRILAEVALFGVAVMALRDAGEGRLSMVFGIVVTVHLALTFPLTQR